MRTRAQGALDLACVEEIAVRDFALDGNFARALLGTDTLYD